MGAIRAMANFVDQLQTAMRNGYSYSDVAQFHAGQGMQVPATPSLDDIMAGSWQAKMPEPTPMNTSTPGVDAINEGAGPIGDAVIMGAAGVAGGLAAGAGAVEGAVDDAVVQSSRAADLGVTTSTDGITAGPSALDQDVENAATTAIGVTGNVAAAGAGIAAFTDKSFDSDLFGNQ